eukprot:102676_1
MSLKKWLQKNQVFDKDLLKLLPKYGVNDPEKDLKNLTLDQWKEIQDRIKKDRAEQLKDNAAKLRLQKKLTKVEKLWRAKRPKKKKKAPKLLKLFDDAPPANGTPKSKKKKGSKSPKKTKTAAGKPQSTDDTTDSTQKDETKEPEKEKWEQYDALKLSDEDEKEPTDDTSYQIGTLSKNESVVDALLGVTSTNETDESKQETKDNNDEWEQYDTLHLSDEEEENESKDSDGGVALFVPLVPLKTQGSVVDMLMDGPHTKKEKRVIPQAVTVTPPNSTVEHIKDYKMTVSFGTDSKEIVTKSEAPKTVIQTDKSKADTVVVSLNSDRFVYNQARNTYSVSLSGCRLMNCDFVNGTIRFEIKGDLVNADQSGKSEEGADDKYIDTVLDQIHRDNPDTEHED